MDVDTTIAVERRHTPVLLQPILIRGDFDETDGREAGRLAGFRLEAAVQVARVLAHFGGGFRRGSEGDHQTRRMPGGAGGETVAFQQDDVLPPHQCQVIGNGGADDAAADDDDAGMDWAKSSDSWCKVLRKNSL